MISRDSVLILKKNSVKEKGKASAVLRDPCFTKKSKFQKLLHRNHQPKVDGTDEVNDERISQLKKKRDD